MDKKIVVLDRPIKFKDFEDESALIRSFNVNIRQDVFNPTVFTFEYLCYFYTLFYSRRTSAQYDSHVLKISFSMNIKELELIKNIEDIEKNLENILFSVLQRIKDNDSEFISNMKLEKSYVSFSYTTQQEVEDKFGLY